MSDSVDPSEVEGAAPEPTAVFRGAPPQPPQPPPGPVDHRIEIAADDDDMRVGRAPAGSFPDLVATFAVAMAAGPFLQAVASHFGTRLAGAIDESTRAALRRFLRREAAELAGTSTAPISLRTDHGWRVTLGADTPAEALAQLLDIHSATAPPLAAEPEPRLTWQQPGVGWLLVGVASGAVVTHTWDASAKRWDQPGR